MAYAYPKLPEEYEPQEPCDGLPCHEVVQLKGGPVNTGHEGPVFAVRYNQQGTYCVSGGKDRTICLWNPLRGILVKKYAGGHGYEVRDVCVAADNSKFASCGGDKQVFIWDVSTGRYLRKLKGHESTVNAVTYAANDDCLVTAGYDQCVKIWDCKSRSNEAMQSMKAFKDSVTGVTVRNTDIIACSVDGTVRRFDLRMGRMYVDEVHHPVTSCAVSHDGECILAACLDSTLRLLDRSSGELLASYQGHVHESVKMDACLTTSDAHVVGSSETGEVLYWDLVEGSVVKKFRAHPGVVCSLAMHPHGTHMLTSALDGVIKVWAAQPPKA